MYAIAESNHFSSTPEKDQDTDAVVPGFASVISPPMKQLHQQFAPCGHSIDMFEACVMSDQHAPSPSLK